MKEIFPEFFIDTNNLKIEDDTLVSFDTSALLEFFCCPKSVKNTLFSYINSIKGNIFIPYHVCLEFLKNQENTLIKRQSELENIKTITNKFIKDIDEELKKSFKFTSMDELSNSNSFNFMLTFIRGRLILWTQHYY